MAHNPIKSIKIDFHTADGLTPKPTPLPAAASTQGKAESAPEKVPTPQTKLSPLEEALFPHWATANGIDESAHSDPNNHYDFRGMFKASGGKVHPTGAIQSASDTFNRLQTSQHPAISSMLDFMKPAPSHANLTTPGSPDLGATLANKAPIMQQEQDQSNSDPIRSLINMVGLGK